MELIRSLLYSAVALVTATYFTQGLLDGEGCGTPQYLELGETGIINCAFPNDFVAIFWVNSSYNGFEEALVRLNQDGTTEDGYAPGEFNIHDNGSLIINNVRLEHEHLFTAVLFRDSSGNYDNFIVRVITTVQPSQTRPCINNCDSEAEVRFTQLNEDAMIVCSVVNSRPAVELKLSLRTDSGDRNISFVTNVTSYDVTYSTFVSTVDVFRHSSMLALLVCSEVSTPKKLENSEYSLLVQNIDFNLQSESHEEMNIKKGNDVVLHCSGENQKQDKYIVWNHKANLEEQGTAIVYAVYGDDSFISEPSNGYELGANGLLNIHHVDIDHEGIYSCLSGNGVDGDFRNYNVRVYATASPVVSGCSPMQYCVLSTSRGTGTLTCKIEGVRPKVQLEFREVRESQSRKVNFKPPETTITVKGNLFDVSVTSEYEVLESVSDSQITIECAVVGASIDLDYFGLPALFDLLITSPNDVPVVTPEGGGLQFLWLLILLPSLVLLVGLLYFCKEKIKTRIPPIGGRDPEGFPMLPNVSPDVIQKFIQQLKTKYEGFYNAVYPVPYIRDRMYCVNTIFVESGIQVMKSHDRWAYLTSYQDILKNAVNRSARIILEGEPGFGKSTLSLQLVYDWCKGISSSPLANVQIVIFLRLRQVGGVTSIAQAVKQFILPRDSSIKENDIQTILQNCSSIVIILDGFDEYPDKDNDVVISEFKNIIKGDIFQDVCLLVTTRAKCMPKEYAPQSKRMRLVGFNSDAQRSYIRKAVVVDNPSKGKAILRRLNENTILSDLCQIPLFFVLFAHITFEDEQFENFTSVSTCFGYVIGCFHEHLRLKSDDKNVKPYQKDHKSLDKVAFDALHGELQQLSWSKDNLLEHLGKEFYSYYVKLGMLIEEEVQNRDPLNSTSLSHYQTEVRFCHKVFCEWFAAHNFADIVSEDDTVLSKKGINPFDSQYVYRFACGLKPEAAEKIISYVRDLEDGDKFSILCFLEQTGKTDTVLETIKTICQSEVIFDGSDSKLLQRSTVQLLEMASTNGIEISRVELYDCVRSADLDRGHLVLSSGIHFHKLSSINQLVIYDEGKHVIYEKARGIINFGMLCHDLRTLAFYRCIMPQTLGRLQHNFSVVWSPSTDTRYNLTQSGKWETTEGKKLSDEQYQLEVRKITQQSQSRDTNGHKPGTEADTAC